MIVLFLRKRGARKEQVYPEDDSRVRKSLLGTSWVPPMINFRR